MSVLRTLQEGHRSTRSRNPRPRLPPSRAQQPPWGSGVRGWRSGQLDIRGSIALLELVEGTGSKGHRSPPPAPGLGLGPRPALDPVATLPCRRGSWLGDQDTCELACWKNWVSAGRREARRRRQEADPWALPGVLSARQSGWPGPSPQLQLVGALGSLPGAPTPSSQSTQLPQPPAWSELETSPSFVNHFPLKPHFGLKSRPRPGERGGCLDPHTGRAEPPLGEAGCPAGSLLFSDSHRYL